MRRRVFNFLSALSLLMCVATGVLWGLGTEGAVYTTVPVTSWTFVFSFGGGSELVCVSRIGRGGTGIGHGLRDCLGNYFDSPGEFWAGEFVFQSGGLELIDWWTQDRPTALSLSVPYWLIELFAVILPLLWLRGRKTRKDHCRRCSYDLTGNTSGVCPECGTAVAGKAEGVT